MSEVSDVSASQHPASPVPPEEDAAVECLDDVTLPPGGRSWLRGRPDPYVCAEPPYLDARGRDMRIDLLRGYFVLAMILDHVRGPSPLYLLTGGNRFFTSAAEGFILTSGLVTGLVYRRMIARAGIGASLNKLLVRAGVLYLLTIGLTLAFLPLSEILYLPWAQGVSLANPLELIVSVLTLHRTYYLVDVMALYTVLFLIAPLAFILIAQGKTWVVLGFSWLLWGLYQFFPEAMALPWPMAGNYLFQLAPWQALFFSGLVLGAQQHRIPTLGCNGTRNALIITGLLTAGLIAGYFVLDPPTDAMPTQIALVSGVPLDVRLWFQENLFAKADVRPGRLFASAIVFSFLFFLTTHFWERIRRGLGWLLLPLGQHALYAYTVHVGAVALVALALAPLRLPYPGPQWLNALIQLAALLAIWALTRWQIAAPTPATRRYWHASPALLVVIAAAVLTWAPSPEHPGLVAPPTARVADAAARLARSYGTPVPPASVPRGTPQPLPTSSVTPQPIPESAAFDLSDGEQRISQWVGEIKGAVREYWFYSAALDRDMPYYIYLPPDYGVASRRYPTLYMLHGGGGHREEWLAYFLVDVADQQILDGQLSPMIIVLPQGDTGYWTNHTSDGPQWGDYVVRDLVSHIDASYRTLRSPAARGIGGLSMGGWGALHNAFRRPDIFGVVGAHSASFSTAEQPLTFLGSGDEFARKDPLQLAQVEPGIRALQIWIDAGDSDRWLAQSEELHKALAARNIPHFWQPYVGGHDWRYWREHVLDYLRFYGNALTRH
jgi:enterochelin esterase-like enzyme